MAAYLRHLTILVLLSRASQILKAEKHKLDRIGKQNEIYKTTQTSTLDIGKICSAVHQVKTLYQIVHELEIVQPDGEDLYNNASFRQDIQTLENGCTAAQQNIKGKIQNNRQKSPGLILNSQSGLSNNEEETLREFEGIFTSSLPSLAVLINFGLDGQSHLLFSVEEVTRLQNLCGKDEIYDVFKGSCRQVVCSPGYEAYYGQCIQVNNAS